MILLWGVANEAPLERVHTALLERRAPCVLLGQRRVLECGITLSTLARPEGEVCLPDGGRLNLAEITGVYARPYDSRRLPAVVEAGPSSPEWTHAMGFEEALRTWLDIAACRVVNRPSAMASNNAKPYHLGQIRALGFRVPETLVTTDPELVRAFWERHGEVVYKSVSGVRSRVSRLGPQHLERLANVAHCPTQFQAYVPGIDVRVHVVAASVFACSIRSSGDDYRYADGDTEMAPYSLPDDVAERCVRAARAMDLEFAGIDLRRTPHGDWFCFEVNPSPGFSYYEHRTGLPIASAVAALLDGTPAR